MLNSLSHFANCFFGLRGKRFVKSFNPNPYYKFDIEVRALHELSHAIVLSLHSRYGYASILDKKIRIKDFIDKSGYFSYRRSEDPDQKELFIDMLICLSGFVGEIEIFGLTATNSYDDLYDWNDYTKKWLIHFNKKYIAKPVNNQEIEWNISLMDFYKNKQHAMLKSLLLSNKELLLEYTEILSKKKNMNDYEVNEFLDKVFIPEWILVELDSFCEDGEINWRKEVI